VLDIAYFSYNQPNALVRRKILRSITLYYSKISRVWTLSGLFKNVHYTSVFTSEEKSFNISVSTLILNKSLFIYSLVRLRAGTGPANRYRSGRTGPDRLRKSTGPVKTGISPVETFEKYPLLTLFLAIKTKISHIFLVEFVKKVLKTHYFNYLF
jgi:hypothetical protein